jgi:hypothetical protein
VVAVVVVAGVVVVGLLVVLDVGAVVVLDVGAVVVGNVVAVVVGNVVVGGGPVYWPTYKVTDEPSRMALPGEGSVEMT